MRSVLALVFCLFAAGCVQARPKHKKHHQSPFDLIDPCLAFECPRGKQCFVNSSTGLAECMCRPSCKPHVKPVCGSDGKLYDNHCELHRAACLSGHHISIIHDVACAQTTTPPPVPPITPVARMTTVKKTAVIEEQLPTAADVRTETNSALPDDLVAVATDDVIIAPNCSEADFLQFKGELLSHYRKQFRNNDEEANPSLPPMTEKFLLSFLFNHLDTDKDNFLTVDELKDALTTDGLQAVSQMCTLEDFLRFDRNGDNRLVAPELYDVYGVQPVTVAEKLQRKTVSAETGTNIVLSCDIQTRYNLRVVWQRKNAVITENSNFDGIDKYRGDDRLYLVKVKLLHTGEYECYAEAYPDVRQIHQVTVHVPPTVTMCPHNQLKPRGSTAKVQCHAQGIPSPRKVWAQNQNELNVGDKYELDASNSSLIIHHIDYADTGIFDCCASNEVGTDSASASVFIRDSSSPVDFNSNNVYYFFHKTGIQIVEPETCAFQESFHADKRLPEDQGFLCHKNQTNGQRECDWGAAVNVKNRYIYASQPTLKRVIVIDLRLKEIIEIIKFDKMPVALTYSPDLDSVWIESWTSASRSDGLHGVKVIRSASEPPPHSTVHLEPTGNHYDVVESLHIPQEQMSGQGEMHYGYTIPHGKQALRKIDLVSLSHVGHVDLSNFNCHPNSVGFTAIGGYVIVNCEATGNHQERQLFVDYVTDKVIGVNEGVQGQVYVTPDGRFVVSVDRAEQHIQVQKVTNDGTIKTDFQVSTNLHISDLGFYPIMTSHAYDLIATSRNREEAIYISLDSGKVEMIPGMHTPIREGDWAWDSHNRKIAPSGLFGPYMVSPSADRVIILNGQYRRLHCDVDHLVTANVFAWVGIC